MTSKPHKHYCKPVCPAQWRLQLGVAYWLAGAAAMQRQLELKAHWPLRRVKQTRGLNALAFQTAADHHHQLSAAADCRSAADQHMNELHHTHTVHAANISPPRAVQATPPPVYIPTQLNQCTITP
jgi:hypothetical protein